MKDNQAESLNQGKLWKFVLATDTGKGGIKLQRHRGTKVEHPISNKEYRWELRSCKLPNAVGIKYGGFAKTASRASFGETGILYSATLHL
ncbi:MAG TPA: hypothetical protein DET40_24205 [Lentisphaeria bacterium]|nr:MAG: hypothetical protein A2X45_21220 [Lentisphaerae bacterium GWF2_50_93]HCE46663.1 hypothetical protein [Lentisphaeria bacterium]